jgi:hypothetical protein
MEFKKFCIHIGFLFITTVWFSPQLLATEASKEIPNARIDDIASSYTSITVRNCHDRCDGEIVNISVRDTGAQKELKTFKIGDHVYLQTTNDNDLQTISIRTLSVSSSKRILVLGITSLLYFFLTALLTKLHPLRLVLGQDGRYSNSKVQMAMWFSAVIVTYVSAVYLRSAESGREFLGGVNIPQNLLLLSGMSALTFGGAKGITTSKVQSAMQAGVVDPKPAAPTPSFWNLVQNDTGSFDIGDFQMLIVTFLAVATYLVLVFDFLGSIELRRIVELPNVDTTVLAVFGLGQGAYLAKKAAGNPGQS